MGFGKKIRNAQMRTGYRRKKAAATVRAIVMSKRRKSKSTNWEFLANPTNEKERAPPRCVGLACNEVDDADDDDMGAFLGWGWLTSCLGFYIGNGGYSEMTGDGSTDESSEEEEDNGDNWSESTAGSRLNQILRLSTKPDDVSDITSAASITIDGDDDDESFGT